jgi:hypothetical protein
VIGGLRIPKIFIAVLPDKMIPGEKASPYTTENKGDFNGTSQLMLTVRLRQSDVLNGNIKFKVPVYAVDDTGALMTTIYRSDHAKQRLSIKWRPIRPDPN